MGTGGASVGFGKGCSTGVSLDCAKAFFKMTVLHAIAVRAKMPHQNPIAEFCGCFNMTPLYSSRTRARRSV